MVEPKRSRWATFLAGSLLVATLVSAGPPALDARATLQAGTHPAAPPLRRAYIPPHRRQSTNSTSSGSGFKIVPLARALLLSASTACAREGGGCAVLNSYLGDAACTTDGCVCSDDVTLAAQVCTQCDSTSQRVQQYNDLLDQCVGVGLATPSMTITLSGLKPTISGGGAGSSPSVPSPSLSPSPSLMPSPSQQAASDLVLEEASATRPSASFLAAPSSPILSPPVPSPSAFGAGMPSPSPSPLPAGGQPSGSSVEFVTINGTITSHVVYKTSSLSFLPVVPSSTSPLVAEQVASPSSISTAVNSPNSLSVTGLPQPAAPASTAAVASVKIFFNSTLSPTCVATCQPWQALATTCLDDLCICATAGLTAAANCSSCVGQAGRSDATTFASQQQAYSKYREACLAQGHYGSGGGNSTANGTGLVALEQGPNGTAATALLPGGTAAQAAAEQGVATAVVISAAGHVTPRFLAATVGGTTTVALALGAYALF